jgi:hypothetical protein
MTQSATIAVPIAGTKKGGFAQARTREAEVAAVLAELRGDFSAPSVTERMLLEQMAAEIVRGRRARAIGRAREAADAARLVSRIAGQLGLRRDRRPGKPQVPSIHEYIASLAPQPAVAPSAPTATEQPAVDDTHGRPALAEDEACGEPLA